MDISVVVPLYNEEESLPELYAWIERVMKAHGFSYEVIFVNDGSTDRSWQIIEELSRLSSSIICQERSVLPSFTKITSYEKPWAFITRSIHAYSSGSDSSSLYKGTTTEISIFLYYD